LISLVILGVGVPALPGCSGTMEAVLPTDGPTMAEIHASQFQASAVPRHDRRITHGGGSLAGYTRQAHNELEHLFPRLPNPTLCGFVFPHISEAGAPVPGYTTCFPMYERTEYALPGEVY